MSDQKSSHFRNRHEPRTRVNLLTWVETDVWRRVGIISSERHAGVIQNLSSGGCFVLTKAEFRVGASVRVDVGMLGIMLEGVVAHREAGRGVGVSFKGVTATQQKMLTRLLSCVAGRRVGSTVE